MTDVRHGSVFVGTKDHAIRMPKRVEWAPQSDITAHEIALCLPVLFNMARGGPFSYPEDAIAGLASYAYMHIRSEPIRLFITLF